MLAKPAPTDQRAAVRPISFVLDDAGELSPPVTLSVRPEDLRRTETLRATVHQTMGREISGWVDSFGEGLPTLTISGHTGWRYTEGSGMDGAQHFDQLNQLVAHDYPDAQQSAIERGIDPALVKLLFIDMLDGFAYTVLPTSFVLQRSKSRPLLIQYNIAMQAIATGIDAPKVETPDYGGAAAGLGGLNDAIGYLDDPGFDLSSTLLNAFSLLDLSMSPIANLIYRLVALTVALLRAVVAIIRSATSFVVGLSHALIPVTANLARAATNVYRSVCNIQSIPSHVRAPLGLMATSYNEIVCIFANSLRPRINYENYEPLFGASGCSSTTGGRQRSAYADKNAFALMQAGAALQVDSSASASIAALAGMDTVLSPMDFQEIGRHIALILEGVAL